MAIGARRGGGRQEDEEAQDLAPLAEINVTPFVDVMLVLLVIFMVTAPLMMAGVPLRLPKTAAARVAEPREPIVLSIDRGGHVFIGERVVPEAALPARLHRMAAAAPDQTVYIRADRALPYGAVMRTMGAVAAAGFSRISLLAEQAPTPSEP
jgi:biopolymer transport protein ExbD